MKEVEYDTRGLRDSIKHCVKSIKNYEAAIAHQEKQIADYNAMIEVLEKKKAIAEGVVIDAEAGVVVDANTDN